MQPFTDQDQCLAPALIVNTGVHVLMWLGQKRFEANAKVFWSTARWTESRYHPAGSSFLCTLQVNRWVAEVVLGARHLGSKVLESVTECV